jgi:nitrogen fixation/metabolism regulation signal transduction histidine kinase
MAAVVHGMADSPKDFTARMKVIILIVINNFVTLSEYEMCDYSISYLFCLIIISIMIIIMIIIIAHGSIVGLGTMLQSGRSQVRVSIRSLNFFSLPNPTSHTIAPGVTTLYRPAWPVRGIALPTDIIIIIVIYYYHYYC